MTDGEKTSLVKAFYEARAKGDMGTIRGFLADASAAMISAAQRKTAGTFRLIPVRKGKEMSVFGITAGEISEDSLHQDYMERDRGFWR